MRLRTLSSEAPAAAPEKTPGGWFSGTLFRKNLGRFWPLWAVYAVIWAVLLPLMQYADLHSVGDTPPVPAEQLAVILCDLKSMFLYGGLWMSVIFGAFFAMAVFSYLTTARSVGLMHTLPIRREGLFLTNYLSGLFLLFTTHVVTILLTVLVDGSTVTAAGGPLAAEYWKVIGIGFAVLTLLSLFFYSFAVFCAQFTGQILAVPVFYAVLNVLVIGVDFLVRTFASLSLYGLNGGRGFSGWALWLSPVAYLEQNLRVVSTWDTNYQKILRYDMVGLNAIWIYGAAGLVFAVLALLAYRRRRSESAGDTVSARWARPVFKYGVAVCCALGLGQGLYALLWSQHLDSATSSLAGVLGCMLVTGLIGYYTAEMLLKKSFRIFRSSWKGAALLAAGLLLFGAGTALDLFGVEGRIPATAQIESVTYQISAQNYIGDETEDPARIDQLRDFHRAVVSEKMTQVSRARESRRSDSYETVYVSITYHLHSGSLFSRSYDLYYTDGELDAKSGAVGLLDQLCSDPSVQRDNVFGSLAVKTVTGGQYGYERPDGQRGQMTLDAKQAQAVYQALLEDMDAGRFNNNLTDRETFLARQIQNDLELYLITESENARQRTTSRNISLNTNCTATLAVLKELGIVTEERPLLTCAEYEARYGDADEDAGKYYEDAPYAETTAEYATEYAAVN